MIQIKMQVSLLLETHRTALGAVDKHKVNEHMLLVALHQPTDDRGAFFTFLSRLLCQQFLMQCHFGPEGFLEEIWFV